MLVIPNRLVRNVYNQITTRNEWHSFMKQCYDQLPVGLIRALHRYLRSQGSNPVKLEFFQGFFHNYIIYWSKHVSCIFSCDDLLCIYSKSLLLVCNPNHYLRCLTLTWPLTWHHDSFTHLAHKTSFLCIIIIFIQCSPYQAVTGKIYRLKQHLLPPATAEGLLKIHILI